MGSMIHLSVGRLEIDWGKNSGFTDHSPLFQPSDLTQVPYYYVDPDNPEKEGGNGYEYNIISQLQDGLSKPLGEVVERIKLLGYTLENAMKEFEYLSDINSFDVDKFSFDQLKEALLTVDVTQMSADYGDGEDFGKFFRRHLFARLGLDHIVDDPQYVQFNAGEGMENLSTYSILLLLAENPTARSLPVNWQFADVEAGGWGGRDEFVRTLDPKHRFLIVTEGSTDAGILKHALKLLKPHLADFFDFVDMAEGYPFTGTGNLFNFTKGLISISVQNNVIILYDNDAEGVSSFKRSARLRLPANMRVLKLPDLPEFASNPTRGPSGEHEADINGRAAAIECYLDTRAAPIVRWNNFNKELGVYQGELIEKQDVMHAFYDLKTVDGDYDFSKIMRVLELLIHECAAMKQGEIASEQEMLMRR
ncbi:HEPN/Toprim-associated domain-containing protein [Rhizobium ruizarguesonis]|uniref:HEPN/Toprim-associated domain-containing protein n=1 Tax=Rhizobium ruizarguesonis TaxID=2081791 RepID=UPI00371D7D0D